MTRLSRRALTRHLHHQQADRQARERGDRAGCGGEPVGQADRVTGPRLDVANVPGHAYREPG